MLSNLLDNLLFDQLSGSQSIKRYYQYQMTKARYFEFSEKVSAYCFWSGYLIFLLLAVMKVIDKMNQWNHQPQLPQLLAHPLLDLTVWSILTLYLVYCRTNGQILVLAAYLFTLCLWSGLVLRSRHWWWVLQDWLISVVIYQFYHSIMKTISRTYPY